MEKLENAIIDIKTAFPGMKILENEPMDRHCSFRVGGPIRALAFPSDVSSLAKLCCILKEHELAPLMLIRPVSGSAALAVGAELMQAHGPDSLVGRTAAVMLGSTETTFYTISVYFGAAGIRKTRHTLPAALIADATGFAAAALTARFLF